MDVNNEILKNLLSKSDEAFQALMDNPSSIELNQAYEDAKLALDSYLVEMRRSLEKRYRM